MGVIIAPILYPHVLGPMLNAFTIENMTEIENRRFYLFFPISTEPRFVSIFQLIRGENCFRGLREYTFKYKNILIN